MWDTEMATTRKTTPSLKQAAASKALTAENAAAMDAATPMKNSGTKHRKPAASGSGKPAAKKTAKPGSRSKKAAPAGARGAVKKAAPKKPAPRKKAATVRTPKAAAVPPISPEQRQELIAKTAYYLAEKRGFEGGDPAVDWFEAEAQVDAILAQRGAPS